MDFTHEYLIQKNGIPVKSFMVGYLTTVLIWCKDRQTKENQANQTFNYVHFDKLHFGRYHLPKKTQKKKNEKE